MRDIISDGSLRLLVPLAPCSLFTALQAFSYGGWFDNPFPIPVTPPLPISIVHCLQTPLLFLHCLAVPLSVVSHHPFPIPILESLIIPPPILTVLGIFLILAIILIIAIAGAAPSTALCSAIRPVLIFISFIGDVIPIEWPSGQKVTLLILLAAWGFNIYSQIITTLNRETLPIAHNIPGAGSEQIGAIDLIHKGMGFSNLQFFILLWHFSTFCTLNVRNLAHHSGIAKHLLQWCGHSSWNCEMWQVVTESREILS